MVLCIWEQRRKGAIRIDLTKMVILSEENMNERGTDIGELGSTLELRVHDGYQLVASCAASISSVGCIGVVSRCYETGCTTRG